MSVPSARCRRAFDVDLVAFVHDASGPAWADFREHYPLCRDCSVEVRTWTELEIVLQGGAPPATTHPTPDDLLRFEEGDGLDADYRRIVEYHIASCRPCADEIATLRAFDFGVLDGRAAGAGVAVAPPAAAPSTDARAEEESALAVDTIVTDDAPAIDPVPVASTAGEVADDASVVGTESEAAALPGDFPSEVDRELSADTETAVDDDVAAALGASALADAETMLGDDGPAADPEPVADDEPAALEPLAFAGGESEPAPEGERATLEPLAFLSGESEPAEPVADDEPTALEPLASAGGESEPADPAPEDEPLASTRDGSETVGATESPAFEDGEPEATEMAAGAWPTVDEAFAFAAGETPSEPATDLRPGTPAAPAGVGETVDGSAASVPSDGADEPAAVVSSPSAEQHPIDVPTTDGAEAFDGDEVHAEPGTTAAPETSADAELDPAVPSDGGFLPPEALLEGFEQPDDPTLVPPGAEHTGRLGRLVRHPAVGVSLVAIFLLPVLWVGELPRFPFGAPARPVRHDLPEARVAVATVADAPDGLTAEERALEIPSTLAEQEPEGASDPTQLALARGDDTLSDAPGVIVPEEAEALADSPDPWALARLDDGGPLEIVGESLAAGLELEVPVPLTVPAGAVLQVQISGADAREIVERLSFPGAREVAVRVPAAWLVPGSYEVRVGVVRRGPAPVRVASYAFVVH